MDEKGVQGGGCRSTTPHKYFFGLLEKPQYKLKNDSLELTTAIECVSAAGFAMKPSFVHQQGDIGMWWEDKRIGCCVPSDNGWTSDDICEKWFAKVFIPTAMEQRVSDAPIVLLLDGHGPHISTGIREIAFKERIFLFCLPPKTTHKTQPLDVGVPNLIQAEWKKTSETSVRVDESVSKATTIQKYMAAREVGMRPDTIIDAWRRTGHHPFNPDVFTDADYAPSKVSSTIAHLPSPFPDVPIIVAPHPSVVTVLDPICPGSPTPDSIPSDPPSGDSVHSDHIAPNLMTLDAVPGASSPAAQQPSSVPNSPTIDLDNLEPVLPQPVGSDDSEPSQALMELPIALRSKLVRGQFVGDWRRLPLKEQVAHYEQDIEALWQALVTATDYGQTAYAHLTLLKRRYEDVCHQLNARNKPKRTSAEASAISKIQKYGFLTNPGMQEAFQKELEEEGAKRGAEAEKAARKEARVKEAEGRRSLIANEAYVFEGTLQSFKTATLERLGGLAASLGVSFTGLKRAEIFEKISSHFETHPGLKGIPRSAGLFRTTRAARRGANRDLGAPVSAAEGADFPVEPPSLPASKVANPSIGPPKQCRNHVYERRARGVAMIRRARRQ
ncbi:hypothetical protein FRC08_014063 [Ceratobasidium sp. 394]|nr:hypothetical protein FRC08_014063 [Ceratobasidium sp. 394]